jgi:hypothetical protein
MIGAKLIAPLAVITTVLFLTPPATAQTAAPPAGRSTQQARPMLPIIGTILEHRVALGLSASQVEALERLGLDFTREAIRRQADLQIAQIDLDVMLDPEAGQTVDAKAAEVKVREIEKIRADLQLALIRAVEAGRAQLTAEQRSALSGLLARTATPGGADPVDDPPDPARGTGDAPPGPARHTPSGSRPAPGGIGHAPPGARGHVPPGGGVRPRPPALRPDGHRDFGRRDHDRVIIRGWSTFWWEPYWFYAPPPVIVEEPPMYVQPAAQQYWY